MGWFWFLGTLLPVIGLVQVGQAALADRYTYVSLTGLTLMLAWGVSDALMVPKTVQVMRKAGMDESEIERVVWRNPIEFFAQSGRISFEDFGDDTGFDRTQLHEGNSVLRGQKP